MRGNFDACLTLLWEAKPISLGGKRGQTRLGLTRKTIASWRGARRATSIDLETLKKGEAAAILHAWFWRGVRGDELPKGLDYALFDAAVYGGPIAAVMHLQHGLGLSGPWSEQMEGRILRAIERKGPQEVIRGLSKVRWIATPYPQAQEHIEAVSRTALAMAEQP